MANNDLVTERVWMGKSYLVDLVSGYVYDIVTENLIPGIHWDDEMEKSVIEESKMWQRRIYNFRLDKNKNEWIFAYVKKFIQLFPAVITRKQADENEQKNIKAEKDCEDEFKEYFMVHMPGIKCALEEDFYKSIKTFKDEYHSHYNPGYPLRTSIHSDKEIIKLIKSNDIGLVLWTNTDNTDIDNTDNIGSEEHLIREMYNPADQLFWWKMVCGKRFEYRMEI